MQCLTWPVALARNQLRLRLVLIITPRLCMLLTILNQSSFNKYLKNAFQSPWICREIGWGYCPQEHLKLKTRQDADRQWSTEISLEGKTECWQVAVHRDQSGRQDRMLIGSGPQGSASGGTLGTLLHTLLATSGAHYCRSLGRQMPGSHLMVLPGTLCRVLR